MVKILKEIKELSTNADHYNKELEIIKEEPIKIRKFTHAETIAKLKAINNKKAEECMSELPGIEHRQNILQQKL